MITSVCPWKYLWDNPYSFLLWKSNGQSTRNSFRAIKIYSLIAGDSPITPTYSRSRVQYADANTVIRYQEIIPSYCTELDLNQ